MEKAKGIRKFALFISLAMMLALSTAGQASADILTFELGLQFNEGGTDPGATAPWAEAKFEDITGGVRLTMTILNLDEAVEAGLADEYISGWYFNFDPNLNTDLLSFTANDISDVTSAGNPQNANFDPSRDIIYGSACTAMLCTADGDGMYDIAFLFSKSNADGGLKRFTNGEQVVFDIVYGGSGTFDVNSFNWFSGAGGGEGSFQTAAHVQSIFRDAAGNNLTQCADGTPLFDGEGNRIPDGSGGYVSCSAWVSIVPEPVSSTLFIIGGAVLGGRAYRKRMKKN